MLESHAECHALYWLHSMARTGAELVGSACHAAQNVGFFANEVLEWERLQKDYEALSKTLETLPAKTSHNVMVCSRLCISQV